jgi:hypothetical protein
MGKRTKETKEIEVQPSDELEKQQALDALIDDALTKDREIGVAFNSLEARIGYGSLIREMQHAYIERVAFYRSEIGGSLSLEEARARSYHTCKDEEEAKRIYDNIMSYSLDNIDFVDLLEMWPVAPRMAEALWEMLKSEAGDAFESGHLASKAVAPVHYMRTAWNVASYLGIRESFITEWEPRGGIELSLIDMLAQAFLQYQYWMEQSVLRTQTRSRELHPEYEQWQKWKHPGKEPGGYLHGYWHIPLVSEQAAAEHAAQMVDRWNRIYMRTLRNLRDLRRYSVPVTINNPQQVNIAADGGQQMNVKSDR